jgi:hypothetical protein
MYVRQTGVNSKIQDSIASAVRLVDGLLQYELTMISGGKWQSELGNARHDSRGTDGGCRAEPVLGDICDAPANSIFPYINESGRRHIPF